MFEIFKVLDRETFKSGFKKLKSIASHYNVRVTVDTSNCVCDNCPPFIGYFLNGKRTDVFSVIHDFEEWRIHRS